MTLHCRLTTAAAMAAMVAAAAPDALAAQASPYKDLQDRQIKALSQEEIDALRHGEGFGFALAAELNGVPGPRHVLDMADSLALDDDQRAAVQAVFDDMLAAAVETGRRIVRLEARLDSMFAAGGAEAGAVRSLSGEIGRLRGRLRSIHLEAHLLTAPLLTPAQLHRYRMARGYHGAHHPG